MIDRIDQKILRILQEDGRTTNQALAEACAISPAACFERVKRLRARGYILATRAILDPRMLDRSLLIFVEVSLDRTTPDVFENFSAAVQRNDEIMECHMVAGGFDYLIKARLKDMEAYRAFLGNVLVDLPGVRETRTYITLEEVKSSTAIPI